jgi:hypothetical protein
MGFFDFFKNKEKEETGNKLKLEIEKIKDEEDIKKYITQKKKEIDAESKKLTEDIENILKELCNELDEEIKELEKVDLGQKKVEKKIMLIVEENLNKYIYYLKKLKQDLGDIEENKFDLVIDKINQIFSEFENRSSTSFQKANILVGKELEEVKDSLGGFIRGISRISNENKDIISTSKKIIFIEKKLNDIGEINNIRKEIGDKLKEIDKKISEKEKEIKNMRQDIEKEKKSDKYKEREKIKQEKNKLEEDLKKEIYSLKELVDFKNLANIYHSDKKKMELINKARENFQEFFVYNEEKIIELIDEARIDNEEIKNKINSIKEKEKKINSIILEKNMINELDTSINRIDSEINEFNEEKIKENKKMEKANENREILLNEIKEKLS